MIETVLHLKIHTMKNFDGTTQTVTGIETKDVKFNTMVNCYLGMVADPKWMTPTRKFSTCTWTKSGKCINKTRPELNLI